MAKRNVPPGSQEVSMARKDNTHCNLIIPGVIWQDERLSWTDRAILSFLIFRQGVNNNSFWGLASMSDDLNISKQTLTSSLMKLEKLNYISRTRTKGGAGKTSIYTVQKLDSFKVNKLSNSQTENCPEIGQKTVQNPDSKLSKNLTDNCPEIGHGTVQKLDRKIKRENTKGKLKDKREEELENSLSVFLTKADLENLPNEILRLVILWTEVRRISLEKIKRSDFETIQDMANLRKQQWVQDALKDESCVSTTARQWFFRYDKKGDGTIRDSMARTTIKSQTSGQSQNERPSFNDQISYIGETINVDEPVTPQPAPAITAATPPEPAQTDPATAAPDVEQPTPEITPQPEPPQRAQIPEKKPLPRMPFKPHRETAQMTEQEFEAERTRQKMLLEQAGGKV